MLMLGFHAVQDEQNSSRDRITKKASISIMQCVACSSFPSKAKEIVDNSSLFSTSVAYQES